MVERKGKREVFDLESSATSLITEARVLLTASPEFVNAVLTSPFWNQIGHEKVAGKIMFRKGDYIIEVKYSSEGLSHRGSQEIDMTFRGREIVQTISVKEKSIGTAYTGAPEIIYSSGPIHREENNPEALRLSRIVLERALKPLSY